MSRPSDWYVVDQPSDPTPGESFGVRALAGTYGDLATTAADAHRTVQAVRQASGGDTWIGKAAEAFRSKLESLPADLDKCADSYEVARDSMKSWASSIETHQFKADKGLADGRAAQHDLSAATSALTSALGTQTNASQSFDKTNRAYQRSQTVTPASAASPTTSSSAPSEADVRRAATARDQADSAVGSAQSSVSAAQSRLDIAKRLVSEARSGYESDARVVVAKLDHAKDVGVRADSWWESVYHSDAWHVVVAVATVAVVVLAVAALIVTGPIGLLVGGAALLAGGLLLANDGMALGAGDESPAEFALAAGLTFLPGGRAVGAGVRGLRASEEVAEGASAVARGTTAAEGIARSASTVRSFSGTIRMRSLTTAEKSLYKRPTYFRAGVRDAVEDNARDADGLVRDPLTNKVIRPSDSWDMGHNPGSEFRKLQVWAADNKLTRREFLDEYQRVEHYRPELPKSNRAHTAEDLSNNFEW